MDRMYRISAKLYFVLQLARAGEVLTKELVLILNILFILVDDQICRKHRTHGNALRKAEIQVRRHLY
jgi:hypothetical protein